VIQFSEVSKIIEYQVDTFSAFKESEGNQVYKSLDVATGEKYQTVGVIGVRKINEYQIGESLGVKVRTKIGWMKFGKRRITECQIDEIWGRSSRGKLKIQENS
jgi:hypothetical protein